MTPLRDPTIIVGLAVLDDILSPLLPITKKIQRRDVDVLQGQAYSLVRDTIAEKNMRKNPETEWNNQLWPKILEVGEEFGVPEEKFKPPRMVGCQVNRANPPCNLLTSNHFHTTIAIPTVDHVINDLSTSMARTSSRLLNSSTSTPQ